MKQEQVTGISNLFWLFKDLYKMLTFPQLWFVLFCLRKILMTLLSRDANDKAHLSRDKVIYSGDSFPYYFQLFIQFLHPLFWYSKETPIQKMDQQLVGIQDVSKAAMTLIWFFSYILFGRKLLRALKRYLFLKCDRQVQIIMFFL